MQGDALLTHHPLNRHRTIVDQPPQPVAGHRMADVSGAVGKRVDATARGERRRLLPAIGVWLREAHLAGQRERSGRRSSLAVISKRTDGVELAPIDTKRVLALELHLTPIGGLRRKDSRERVAVLANSVAERAFSSEERLDGLCLFPCSNGTQVLLERGEVLLGVARGLLRQPRQIRQRVRGALHTS